MKPLKFTLLMLGAAFALTGCYREVYDFCPEEETAEGNVRLNFCLPDGSGGCTFMQDISNVNTAVFSADGTYVKMRNTTDGDHADFKGVVMTLDPGTYKVICWANSNGNTALNNVETCYTGNNSTIAYGNITDGTVGNCDRVYYGPNTVQTRSGGNAQGEFIFTVGNSGYEGTVEFRNAHRTLEIYVAGYDYNGSATPDVELTGLPAGLSFLGMGQTGGASVTSKTGSNMVTVNEGGTNKQYALAKTDVFWFRAQDTDIGIRLLTPTGDPVFEGRLNDYIDVPADDPDKIIIRLKIEFKSGIVEVTLPDWNSNDVDYGVLTSTRVSADAREQPESYLTPVSSGREFGK